MSEETGNVLSLEERLQQKRRREENAEAYSESLRAFASLYKAVHSPPAEPEKPVGWDANGSEVLP